MNHDGHMGSSCCHRLQFDLWSDARRRQLKLFRTGWYGKTKNVVIDKQMTLSITIYYKFYVVLRYSICGLHSISLGRIQMVNWDRLKEKKLLPLFYYYELCALFLYSLLLLIHYTPTSKRDLYFT